MDVTHSILSDFDNFFFSCLASNVGKHIEHGVKWSIKTDHGFRAFLK